MPTYGKVSEFGPESDETWEIYCERLKHFYSANKITDNDKRKSILLSACGSKAYKLMCNLLAPDKPGDKSFNDLVTLLKQHYNPIPSEVAQRFKFNNRIQQQEESIAEFVQKLRGLSVQCNFENHLEKMIRDRLVAGLRDKEVQLRLLAEPDLTLDSAFKLASGLEAANINSREFQAVMGTPVHKVSEAKKVQQNQE